VDQNLNLDKRSQSPLAAIDSTALFFKMRAIGRERKQRLRRELQNDSEHELACSPSRTAAAHIVRDEGVAGSNPATPTKQIP